MVVFQPGTTRAHLSLAFVKAESHQHKVSQSFRCIRLIRSRAVPQGQSIS